MSKTLIRSITLPQAIALYVAAVVGAGVLLLPGLAATEAGPASILGWGFDGLLGIPLALTFAALASRFPDAGGVATFTTRAFGKHLGAASGWFYFFAAVTGQIIVSLTGAYYVATALGLDRNGIFLLAAAILTPAILANMRGLHISGKLALGLSASVVLLLLAAIIVSLPHLRPEHWTPFAPHGIAAIGHTGVLIFFAFFGWEAIAQLTAEFHNPARDVIRSTLWSVGIVTILYVGIAFVTIGTGTYGAAAVNQAAVAYLLSNGSGVGIRGITATLALIITLGTVNAYVAATSRLGYALARDHAFPAWLQTLDRRHIPVLSVLLIGGLALAGLLLTYLAGWSADTLLFVPNSLGLATYLLGTAAGVRVLTGKARWLAAISFLSCLAITPFVGASILLPVGVASLAIGYRRLRQAPLRTRKVTQQTVIEEERCEAQP